MSYTKRALKGFIIVFSINIIAAFLGYLIRIVLARNLTVAEYGLFFSVFTLLSLLAVFIDLGLGQALVKFIPEFIVKNKLDKIANSVALVFTMQVLNAFILAILLFIFSDFIAIHYFKNIRVAPLLLLFLAIMLFSNLKGLVKCLFQSFQRMHLYSFMYLVENALLLALLLISFSFSKSITIPIYSYISTYALLLFLFIPFFLKIFKFFNYKLKLTKGLVKKLVKFGIPTMFIGIGSVIIVYTDTLVLTYFRNMSEVGIYNAVVPTAMLLIFFTNAIVSIIFPLLSELWARKKKGYVSLGIKMLEQYVFAIMLPVALIIMFFSRAVLELLFGPEYASGALTMQILLIAMIFLTMYSLSSTVLSAIGKPEIATRTLLQGAMINLGLNLILIPRLGMIGAAITSLLAYAYVGIQSTIKLRKFIKIKIPWFHWLRIAAAGIIMIVAVFLLRDAFVMNVYAKIIVISALAGFFYLALIVLMRVISLKETKSLLAHLIE